jgi:hypothetical protein
MYQCKQMQISWWPFSPPCGGKDKHQKRNNKKTCHVVTLEGLDVNQNKRISKLIEHQFKMHMGYDGKNKDVVNQNGKHQ